MMWGEGTGKVVNNTEVRLMMKGEETENGEVEKEDSGKGMWQEDREVGGLG